MAVPSVLRTYVLCVSILILSSCATGVTKSHFVEQILTVDPQKASVFIYRTSKEHWLIKNRFIAVYVDGNPFLKIKAGEHLIIFLNKGMHTFEAESLVAGNLTAQKIKEEYFFESGKTYYLSVYSRIYGIDWYFASPFQLIPLPLPGIRVSINDVAGEHAKSEIGDDPIEIQKRLIR